MASESDFTGHIRIIGICILDCERAVYPYLEGVADIQYEHLAEAINYRCLDRDNWGS